MFKKILVILMVLILVTIWATSASAFVVNWFNSQFEVKEPIIVKVLREPPTAPLWPGTLFATEYEIQNRADNMFYGMSYDGYISYVFYYNDDRGATISSTLKFELNKQPMGKEPSVRLLQKPTENAGGPWPWPNKGWGQIIFTLTANGAKQAYVPGTVVIIGPSGSLNSRHVLLAEIRPSADIPPGKWQVSLWVDRNEPEAGTVEPSPTPIPLPTSMTTPVITLPTPGPLPPVR